MKDAAHVVQQPRDGQHHCGRFQVVPAVQEELCVLIPLSSRLHEPIACFCFIALLQVQFTESVLRVLVPGISGLCEVLYRFGCISVHNLSLEVFLAQPIGRTVVYFKGGLNHPQHTPKWI